MIAKCRKCTRCKTILLPLMNFSYCLLSRAFTKLMCEIRSYLNRGILDPPSQNEISKQMINY